MFRGLGLTVWFGERQRIAPGSSSGTELRPLHASMPPAAPIIESKSEVKEPERKDAAFGPALNIFDNLKTTVTQLEIQLRRQLEKNLDPDIYQAVIAHGKKDPSGRRYEVALLNGCDLSLISETPTDVMRRKALQKNKPIVIKRGDQYSIYGCLEGLWETRGLDDLSVAEQSALDSLFEASPENEGVRSYDPVLRGILKKGHALLRKEDMTFYYQHVLNLLTDFQGLMGSVSVLHRGILKFRNSQGFMAKTKQLLSSFWSSDEERLLATIKRLVEDYCNFVTTFGELELDTVLGHLPAFEELKELIKLLKPVQTTTDLLKLNPIVASYNRNSSHLRELMGLQPSDAPQRDAADNAEEADAGYGEEKESKHEAKAVAASVAAETKEVQEGESLAQQGALQILHDLPRKLNAIEKVLTQILGDLNGEEVSLSVKKDYEQTIVLVTQILRELEQFSPKTKNLKNIISFIHRIYPLVKTLLASLPQAYVSLNKILREHLMTTARQFNLILRDWFLFADRMESQLYLKDGLLLGLDEEERTCPLFMMQDNPRDLDSRQKLATMLGSAQHAYILHEDVLYYANRYFNREKQEWRINVKSLRFQDRETVVKRELGEDKRPVPDQREERARRVNVLRMALEVPAAVAMDKDGYYRIHPNLKPYQLRLIDAMLKEQGPLTGRYLQPSQYEPHDFSIAHFAKEFNAWVEGLGYEFLEEERYPYTRDFIDQRQKLLSAEQEAAREQKGSLPRAPYKKDWLAKRLAAKTALLAAEEALAERNKRVQDLELCGYKQSLILAQIDKRIADLKQEMETRWVKLSDKKENKIVLLQRLRADFIGFPYLNCEEHLSKLNQAEQNLLHDGRTGKLLQTLSLVTTTPADRDRLVDIELARLKQECAQARNAWFFAERRQADLTKRIDALEAFRRLLKPGYRTQEILDDISAKRPELFAVLLRESTFLAQLKKIDQFTPDCVLGKRSVDFVDSMFRGFKESRERMPQVAIEEGGVRPSRRQTYFFSALSGASTPTGPEESKRGGLLPSPRAVSEQRSADRTPDTVRLVFTS